MFLTRMALDITQPDTAALLADGHILQRTVLSTFAGGNLQPLFRLDNYSSRTWLVILSQLRPTMNAIHQRYGYPGVFPSWETFDYDDVLEDADHASCWFFELSASPVGFCEDAQMWLDRQSLCEWLIHQGDICGFRLRDVQVTDKAVRRFDQELMPVARWHGALNVIDPEQFRWAVCRGIGAAVAQGIGLMTLSRAYTLF